MTEQLNLETENEINIIVHSIYSDVYENIYIEIFNKKSKFNQFIFGNIRRIPSAMTKHMSTFITEFNETLNTVQ